MSTVFQTRIESYEVQPNDNVRPSTLFHLFQKAAGDDLDGFGMTYNYLRENGIVFVVTKFTLEYFDNIHSYDNVTIATFPRGCRGVSFIRDFDVTVNGKRAAYATSSWVLLDINNRTLLRPSAIEHLGTIGHMNNTFYPDIVYDYFPDSYKNDDIGKKFSIYYSSEILRGEKFDIYTAETGREFTFLAKNPATGKDIFSALIDF